MCGRVWLIHFALRQKLTQHCKAIMLQLKKQKQKTAEQKVTKTKTKSLSQVSPPAKAKLGKRVRMLGWREDGRKHLLLCVRRRESALKGPEQPLEACVATLHSNPGGS